MALDENDGDGIAKRIVEHERAYEELWRSSRGVNVAQVERRLRDFARTYAPYIEDVDVAMQARVMSDSRWGLKHPLGAVAIAWKFRNERSLRRTLSFFLKPRFAG